jgi:endonuclease/exonuclease/phosphatase family metal-dependent hydrolase
MKPVGWALCLLLLTTGAQAAELKIATWNLNWLTTKPAGSHGLPEDVKARSADDFAKLKQYAIELDADVIAVEEVDGRQAAEAVFPADKYSIHMTRDHVLQRTGLIVRRGLHYDVNPDVTALAANPAAHLRSGADITLHLKSGSLRLLAVHLKTGCWEQSLVNTTRRSCIELAEQIAPLKAWIEARRAENVPFLILGDFNRGMDGHDSFIADLRQAAPLKRATEGHSSPCWGSATFIDHILAGGAAADWMRPDTLRVLRYRETEPEWKERLSDHCPVSVRFAVPDGAG